MKGRFTREKQTGLMCLEPWGVAEGLRSGFYSHLNTSTQRRRVWRKEALSIASGLRVEEVVGWHPLHLTEPLTGVGDGVGDGATVLT